MVQVLYSRYAYILYLPPLSCKLGGSNIYFLFIVALFCFYTYQAPSCRESWSTHFHEWHWGSQRTCHRYVDYPAQYASWKSEQAHLPVHVLLHRFLGRQQLSEPLVGLANSRVCSIRHSYCDLKRIYEGNDNNRNTNSVEAVFTPTLSAYATSDYQETQLITGEIISPVLLKQDLALLPDTQLYNILKNPDGSYSIVPGAEWGFVSWCWTLSMIQVQKNLPLASQILTTEFSPQWFHKVLIKHTN